jgi:hypothetical protein
MKPLKSLTFLALVAALGLTYTASASQNAMDAASMSKLSTATAAELPAQAAELVKQAPAKNLTQTTIAVVKASVGLNPAAAPAIVGSIAHISPDMAGTAAATAVALVPDQAVAIAKAAAAAAPTQVGAIVEAICKVLPQGYKVVALAVAEVVPGADKEILRGIALAIPELNTAINQTLASGNGKIDSLNVVLAQIAQSQNTAGTVAASTPAPLALPQGSGFGTSFVAVPVSVGNVKGAGSGPVGGGGNVNP